MIIGNMQSIVDIKVPANHLIAQYRCLFKSKYLYNILSTKKCKDTTNLIILLQITIDL